MEKYLKGLILMITNMIKSGKSPSIGYKNYKNFCISDVFQNRMHPEGFVSYKSLTFKDFIGEKYLCGEELIYYPELTKQLRAIKYSPILERKYPINSNLKGMGFIKYFYERSTEAFECFSQELATLSSQANNLVHIFGIDRRKIIINGVEEEKTEHVYSTRKVTLIINGVRWDVDKNLRGLTDHSTPSVVTEYLDLKTLLKLPCELIACFESALVDTPYIALHVRTKWKNKGRIEWYSLETLKKVSKQDILNFKK